MFIRNCAAYGCVSDAAGFSTLCSRHRKAKTRHGHPSETSVSSGRLRPYLRKVEARYKVSPDNEAWSILTGRWHALVDASAKRVESFYGGAADVRFEVQAAQQVITLAAHSAHLPVVFTCLAMYLLRDAEPRAFRNDDGFDYQLVRRVRALAPVNSGSYWNHRTGRMTKVYRDLPPRTVEALAWLLNKEFGSAGLQLAGLDRDQVSKRAVAQQRLADSIDVLQ